MDVPSSFHEGQKLLSSRSLFSLGLLFFGWVGLFLTHLQNFFFFLFDSSLIPQYLLLLFLLCTFFSFMSTLFLS